MEYLQNYNPTGNAFVSTLLAAVPVVTLLYLLALHPTKSSKGSIHKGIAAHYAAAVAGVVALLIAIVAFRMPVKTAGMSFIYGAMYGLFPIGWIIISAMFLYTITLVSGLFEVLKDSVATISDDRRIQAILIAFSFGAFVEGAAGFGTPVAISGALMVGLGFRPLQAAILCLIANTAPVAFGALGTPITALSTVTGIDAMLLSKMAARQLPFFSVIVPVWMTAVQVRMDKRPWSAVWEVWPALLVSGGSFAITQFLVGNYWNHLLVDILGGVVSMAAVAVHSRYWKPARRYEVEQEEKTALVGGRDATAWSTAGPSPRPARGQPPIPLASPGVPGEGESASDGAGEVLDYHRPPVHSSSLLFKAWLPWALLTLFVFLWGYPAIKNNLNKIPGAVINWDVPAVQGVVYRTPPVVKDKAIDRAVYSINWLTAPGTGILMAAVISGVIVGLRPEQWKLAVIRTASRLRLPLLTISLVLGMGFITKYSGMDAVMGLAFTKTGWFYPFFAAMLGWLGVALTGSDTSSNVMFGSMQKITAEQLGLDPVLITTANSTGGVMGKMIDAQSIVVATAACYEDKEEGKLAAGPIFRGVLVHSVVLAMLMGVLVMLQAYVWTGMIPKHDLMKPGAGQAAAAEKK